MSDLCKSCGDDCSGNPPERCLQPTGHAHERDEQLREQSSKDERKTRVRVHDEQRALDIPPTVRTVRAMRNRRRVIE